MTELMKEIKDYWNTRTEGYSEVNEKELLGTQKEAWLRLLKNKFPQKARESLRILDIGTGPGFFPVILAGEGYYVDAVDYTEGMLEKAKENVEKYLGNKKDHVSFYQMDAQDLDFQDNTFDVVITRNLTWNLPDPIKAYQEWIRVLRPGGQLFNFDANWYGYLYDEEKRLAYDKDRKNVEKENLDDHYLCTDIDRMEEIARQVPLSGKQRPAWDEKVLTELHASVTIDTNVWDRVWSTEEKLNYGSTPMFMIQAVKQELWEGYTLGDLTVQPGHRAHGFLTLGNGEFSFPVTVIRGKNPGKTVLITAGIHPGEYVGIQSAVELAEDLNVEKMSGTVILVKVVCREAFEARKGSADMAESGNLNRLFPGKKEGKKLEKLAFAVVTELQEKADYYIDLHSGDDYEELASYVYYAGRADARTVEISRHMAQQVDVPYMVQSDVVSGGAYNYAASQGIPSVLLERGGMGCWDAEEVRSMKRDVRTILRYLGIYDGHKSYRKYYPLEVKNVQYQDASYNGLWYPEKKAGDLFESGDVLGYVRDYEGKELECCVAYSDGVILYQTRSLQVLQDGPMITYGQISYENDDRKERITNYWTKRSDSFLKQRRDELHSPLASRWMNEIHKCVQEKGRKLKILDVGCGAGFFSVLLAKEGHMVTGIDLTPNMIEGARSLAKEEGVNCTFQVMDAETLKFEDNCFDMVISRNLTWTLPNASKAYGEWMRVLKKGGFMLNFDANYGLEDSTDTSSLPKMHAHNMLGSDMMRECDEIKHQLPISSCSRPAWDLQTLETLGVKRIYVDLGISSRIYCEKDEFYNPTPMFLLWTEK